MKKISPKNLKEITNILKEESTLRHNIRNEMYDSKKKSLMTESLMFEGYSDVAPEDFVRDVNDDMKNYSRDLISVINTKLYRRLSSFMKLSGIATMTPNSWMDELEAFDVYEHEMQLANDIKEALDTYALSLAKAAFTVVGPPEEEETENDVDPRYSEYE